MDKYPSFIYQNSGSSKDEGSPSQYCFVVAEAEDSNIEPENIFADCNNTNKDSISCYMQKKSNTCEKTFKELKEHIQFNYDSFNNVTESEGTPEGINSSSTYCIVKASN